MLDSATDASPISHLTAKLGSRDWFAGNKTAHHAHEVADDQASTSQGLHVSGDLAALHGVPVRRQSSGNRAPLQAADAQMLASRYNSTPSSTGTPQLLQDASPSPTPYIRRRLDTSLEKLPACSTPRRSNSSSSAHRRRRQLRGPSASADFDTNKENRMQDWLGPAMSLQPPLKAKRKLYCGKSPPSAAGVKSASKRHCPMHQSMPGPLRFDRTASTDRLRMGSAMQSLQMPGASLRCLDIPDTANDSMNSSLARSSMSQKPPLSPYGPSSFPGSFSMFAADRVQSSPCVMQTDHAEQSHAPLHAPARSSGDHEISEMILADDQPSTTLISAKLKPSRLSNSRLSSETNLNDLAGHEKLPEAERFPATVRNTEAWPEAGLHPSAPLIKPLDGLPVATQPAQAALHSLRMPLAQSDHDCNIADGAASGFSLQGATSLDDMQTEDGPSSTHSFSEGAFAAAMNQRAAGFSNSASDAVAIAADTLMAEQACSSSTALPSSSEAVEPAVAAAAETRFSNMAAEAAAAAAGTCLSNMAAAAAAEPSGFIKSSSPSCTFQLPSALLQGITDSPAPEPSSQNTVDTARQGTWPKGIPGSPDLVDSEGSARRKSFSPLDTGPVSILPMVENPETGLPSISSATLASLLSHSQHSGVTSVKIVDCRYAFEHAGGHIPGAVNIPGPDDAEAFTFGSRDAAQGRTTAIILYCEFSSERAPRMFRYLRNMDRRNHLADYPQLTFPHMFVLRGGYKAFHQQYPALCVPQHAYVRMHDAAYIEHHRACRKVVKAAWDLKAACSRSLN